MKKENEDKYRRIITIWEEVIQFGNDVAIRDEVANRTQISKATIDRYMIIYRASKSLKKLFLDGTLCVTTADYIGSLSAKEQEELANIFIYIKEHKNKLDKKQQTDVIGLYKKREKSWRKICDEIIKKDNTSHNKSYAISKRNKLKDVDTLIELNGVQFEIWLKELIEKMGYSDVEITPRSYDGGKDIIANKEGYTYCFQCKKMKNERARISINAIQEVYVAKDYGHYDFAVAVTNSYFNDYARRLANGLKVKLWDGKQLKKLYTSVLG